MERSSSSSAGSCLGLVAVAVVSTSIILMSYQLHRRLEADLRLKIEQQRRRQRTTKKVRFADDVVEPSSNNEEYRKLRAAAAGLRPALRKASST